MGLPSKPVVPLAHTQTALAYSIIAPIINGLAVATFFLFYMLYKYLFLWVYNQPSTMDTGGRFFPKAIQHVFVGLYIQELCLCALFFLTRNPAGKAGALPEAVLMIILIVFTVRSCCVDLTLIVRSNRSRVKAFFHGVINNSYDPLLEVLPMSLADKTHSDDDVPVRESSESAPLSGEAPGVSAEARDAKAEDNGISPVGEVDHGRGDVVETNADAEERLYGFAHPAVSRPQRTVWIPQDELGLAGEEEKACREAGVRVSTRDAAMDEKGKVSISGAPPDVKED